MKWSVRGFVIIGLSLLFLFLILRTAVIEANESTKPTPPATRGSVQKTYK